MRAALTILLKDLRQQFRDTTLLTFGLALPLGLAFLLTLTLGGNEKQQFIGRYAVAGGAAFTEQVLRPMAERGYITLRELPGWDAGAALVDKGEVDAVFVVPPDGRTGTLEVIGNVDAAIAVDVARGLAQSYATELRTTGLAVAVAMQGRDADAGELARLAQAAPTPVALDTSTPVLRKQLDPATYHAAGMAVFFLFFGAVVSAAGIFAERAGGTLVRLIAAPIPRWSIVAGKSVGGVVTGIVTMTVLIATSGLLLGARWGDPLGVAALVAATVLAVCGITTVVASFARTAEQASNWVSIVATVLGVFGGALFPIAQVGLLPYLGYVTPHRWFLSGLAELAGGGTASAVVSPVLVLLAIAVVTGGVAVHRSGRMLRVTGGVA
ncbi:ABC transporter permease [Sinosporangium siamense]|uniref:ABC transmembrane type-2 domain-containing protein n=1 Tax=Sinosporangium siamense TaxID=1367973 RepID=A0A919V6F2_9ACTN|nr:ABC transporter permease [Sinosporangium siamense]GII90917.1 hypothetical protein Ssi02_11480 [Sinosporangium siamense]